MKRYFSKEAIIITLLVVLLCVSVMNFIAMAQAPTEEEAFPFFRLPDIFGNYRQASVKYYKNKIIKWTMLVSIPVGATDVYNDAGQNVVWDQVRIDGINAKIAEYYVKLDELGEGDWQYTYTP